jgi:hypothetical protein
MTDLPGEEVLRTGLIPKGLFQSRFVRSIVRRVKAKENTGTAPETGTLSRGTFMNVAQAKRAGPPVPKRDLLLSSEKTVSKQSSDCYTCIASN